MISAKSVKGAERQKATGRSEQPGPIARRSIARLQLIAFAFGAALLAYVIHRVGVGPIFDALASIGIGFFPILAISGLRHVLRTQALRTAIEPTHRQFTFGQAFAARLGGEAITFLTFTGPLLGEATKAALLRRTVPLVHSVQALIVDNILYNLSVALFILSGACVMLANYTVPPVIGYALISIVVCMGAALIVASLALRHRIMPVTWLLARLGRTGVGRKLIRERSEHVRQIEASVYDFYTHRRGAFLAIVFLDLLSHASSVFEVYFILDLLGASPKIAAAYIIESLTKVINFAFGFVPATIGVYEGGTEVILRALGFAAATGVTLALARKAGMVFWTSIGLLVLMWRAGLGALERLAAKHPRLRRAMDNLVLSNLAHRPARTFTSILGIAIGVLLITFTVGLAHGLLQERARREANMGAEIMVRASGTFGLSGSEPFLLPVSRAEEIEKIEGVRAAVPIGQSTVSSDTGFGMRLVDGIPFEKYAAIANLHIVEGRGLNEAGDEAIVDTVWQEQRRAGIGATIQLYDRPFRIVGVYEPPNGARVKIPLKTMQEQVGSEGRCTAILVACENPAEQERVAARIHERFPEDQIIFTRDLPELYTTSVPALNIFIEVVVAIAAIISFLVVLLAMYTTVTERTRQIGILKSLGMSNAQIAWVIEQEALLVSVLGIIFGLILTLLARAAVMRATSLVVEIELRWVAVAALIGVVGGIVGALYPALRAARQDPVQALSYE
ncbi:ABC transporter permease [Pyrinomonas methylaliphatogenes]|uniref:ABC-type transport system, involved in lipoprotein release, permease component n=1 Tax=Pyrinomonas methylaliphatogenes TaxID=454194 RepID=A0A0B6WU23_9BACT|nr:ABC transporter permease [Pyrinomonas methylaliphatogenes]MBX5479541.1 ABC transporter permease [Pyrinomonas methylaliphatogenes]CDM64733.1 ABC-type transport system, involved in lipoprotein release, permease component [Pyrinomonas methylaliphatogenes]